MKPILLAPDNFTPTQRTPWGGTRIVDHYKRCLVREPSSAFHERMRVGESWELSVEPDFPSRTADGTPLSDLFARDPVGYLGEEAPLGGTRLLVKLLDAAEPLSVQIHPSDDSPGLEPDQSGKPEAWYILERCEGAGIFVGLGAGTSEAELRASIASGDDVSSLFCFVPVEPGDFFVLEAGTPHAIGGGITLVEPQRVLPGKRGVTFRFWDWNRRYAPDGSNDLAGTPRALHLEQALSVTNWSGPREDALLARIRHRAGAPVLDGPATLARLCGPDGPVCSNHLSVARIVGSGALTIPVEPRLRALTVVNGSITLIGPKYETTIEAGRTAALPAGLEAARAELDHAHAVLSAIA